MARLDILDDPSFSSPDFSQAMTPMTPQTPSLGYLFPSPISVTQPSPQDGSPFVTVQPNTPVEIPSAIRFPCGECNEVYSTATGLTSHIKEKHIRPYSCERGCDNKAFKDKRGLRRHYESNIHRQADASVDYCCGCASHTTPRRDFHLKHVRTCKKYHSAKASFKCGRCQIASANLSTHMAHLQECKGH